METTQTIEAGTEQTIDDHLRIALFHLETALDKSLTEVLANQDRKKEIGQKWEQFLGHFFNQIREKGKQHRVNLLSWISFPRFR
ncbi:hypothetical protein [Effusibacillus dendaii]|uniref:Uncharacterized protein n=1 Tax=Effusibacillus dendaii TaxID=2743772 RepID=A0A7I8DDU4_9BACL|nr:hypothetical protein [Effusibacillus dendaii]BCJ88383.1 hypothetical protein skT53_33680 [Effusibacillus dendaii]